MKVLDDLAGAKKELKLADHMIYVTYKLLNDQKIILAIVDHISNSLNTAIFAFLDNERIFKRVYHVPEDKRLKMRFFLRDYSEDLDLDVDDEDMIIRLDNLRNLNKRVNYNLQKGNSFYFVNSGFKVETIDLKTIKHYLERAKGIINTIEGRIRSDNARDSIQY